MSSSGARASPAAADQRKEKVVPKMTKSLSTSAKRMQKELGEITLDPPPNCRYFYTMETRRTTLYRTLHNTAKTPA